MVTRAKREWESDNEFEGFESELTEEIIHSEVDVPNGTVDLEILVSNEKESVASIFFTWKPKMEDLAALMEMGVKKVNKARNVLESL